VANRHKKKTAKSIYEEYVAESAPKSINISADCREKVRERLIAHHDVPDTGVFDDAVKEVDNMLVHGPFPRFAGKVSDVVAESWKRITMKMSVAEVGKILFMNWFVKAPYVMPLFKKDMAKHGKMLVAMIENAVNLLSDLRKLVPKLAELGHRHREYGAEALHFDSLKGALIETLKELLENEFTEEIDVAWKTTFDMMIGIMSAAMEMKSENSRTRSTSRSTSRKVAPDSAVIVLLHCFHENPQLLDSLELYYNLDDISCWRELYDLDRNSRKEAKWSNEKAIEAARHIFETYFEERKLAILYERI
jgi:hemoglobin-like flavoprotein